MEDEDYSQKQLRRQEEYATAYSQWTASLSPEQLKELKLAGVEKSYVQKSSIITSEPQNERPEEGAEVDFAGLLDAGVDEWLEATKSLNQEESVRWCYWTFAKLLDLSTVENYSKTIRRVIGGLMMRDNPALQIYGVCFAMGLETAQGASMTEVARKLGCTRAAISKVSIWWAQYLNVPRSRYMKSKAACEKYSTVQKADHWRKRAHKVSPKELRPNRSKQPMKADLI